MTAIEALEQLKDCIDKKKEDVYKDIAYANQHHFDMERIALQYKSSVLSDINGEIMVMLHNLYNEDKV